jgi:FkbM family methyltransferase
MTNESQTVFLLRAQSELLEASLNEIPNEANKQRKAITRRLTQTFFELVNRLNSPLVVEIGAHEGSFSKHMKNSRPESRVVAFEAHPLVYARYAPAMKQAGVEYLHVCIGDREGDMILKVPKQGDLEKLGKGSLLRTNSSKAAEPAEYPVRAVTLDGFLGDAAGLPNVMWIDVEGALAHVLAGAERALRNCQALYVEMETSERWEGQILDTDVLPRLAVYGLKPVLRDIQKPLVQYNAVFVR